mgnify:CR=1 FL=1
MVASCVTSASASDVGYSAGQSKRPTLLVNIVVEGLDGQYLGLLRDSFDHNGFGRLMSSAAYADDIDYGSVSNSVAAAAMLQTGTGASVHAFLPSWSMMLQPAAWLIFSRMRVLWVISPSSLSHLKP